MEEKTAAEKMARWAKAANTDANGSGSAMCPNGHPWYTFWTTDDDGVRIVEPSVCPDIGAGHEEGCGLGWVATMCWGGKDEHDQDRGPGEWVERAPEELAVIRAEVQRRIEAGKKPVADVAEALSH